jgi:tRNA(fMet)-specific endonuclease VapC
VTRLVPVLYPQGPGICEHYAVQATALKHRATPIGATVVSHNVSEFSRVDGLQLVDWAV